MSKRIEALNHADDTFISEMRDLLDRYEYEKGEQFLSIETAQSFSESLQESALSLVKEHRNRINRG